MRIDFFFQKMIIKKYFGEARIESVNEFFFLEKWRKNVEIGATDCLHAQVAVNQQRWVNVKIK